MDKLLKLLGADKLDEAAQESVKEKLQHIVEVKSKEHAADELQIEKDKLIEEYEQKFEDYKEEITSKFSNFVDSVIDEEFTLPEKIVEFAKKGELYSELIEQFKIRLAIDEGLLEEEVKNLLREAKDEIVSLRETNDASVSEKLELELDAQKMAAALYLREKCDGLTEEKKKYILGMLEGITDRAELDSKFSILMEQDDEEEEEDEDVKESDDEDEEEDDEEDADESERIEPKSLGDPEAKKARKKNNDEADPDEDEVDENKGKKGKGMVEVKKEDKDADKVDEEDSPFKPYEDLYVQTLTEGI